MFMRVARGAPTGAPTSEALMRGAQARPAPCRLSIVAYVTIGRH